MLVRAVRLELLGRRRLTDKTFKSRTSQFVSHSGGSEEADGNGPIVPRSLVPLRNLPGGVYAFTADAGANCVSRGVAKQLAFQHAKRCTRRHHCELHLILASGFGSFDRDAHRSQEGGPAGSPLDRSTLIAAALAPAEAKGHVPMSDGLVKGCRAIYEVPGTNPEK